MAIKLVDLATLPGSNSIFANQNLSPKETFIKLSKECAFSLAFIGILAGLLHIGMPGFFSLIAVITYIFYIVFTIKRMFKGYLSYVIFFRKEIKE